MTLPGKCRILCLEYHVDAKHMANISLNLIVAL